LHFALLGWFLGGALNAAAILIDAIAAMQPPAEAAFGHGPFGIALAVLMAGVAFELDVFGFGHFVPPYILLLRF
jgi:hypothetical protein